MEHPSPPVPVEDDYHPHRRDSPARTQGHRVHRPHHSVSKTPDHSHRQRKHSHPLQDRSANDHTPPRLLQGRDVHQPLLQPTSPSHPLHPAQVTPDGTLAPLPPSSRAPASHPLQAHTDRAHDVPHAQQFRSLPNPQHPVLSAPDVAQPLEAPGLQAPKPVSHRLLTAFRKKPTLSRTWEKKSFADEMRSAPLDGTNNQLRDMAMSDSPRPTSLYASPAALAAFRPLPALSAPATPAPPSRMS